MKLTIARTSLTKSHLLYVSYQLLQLIVCSLNSFVQLLFCHVICVYMVIEYGTVH